VVGYMLVEVRVVFEGVIAEGRDEEIGIDLSIP
jgi:hypothetical protein